MDKEQVFSFFEAQGVTFSDDAYASIEHEGIFINMQFSAPKDFLHLYVALGRLPDPAPTEILEELLTANLLGAKTHGGHLGLYPPQRVLVYSYTVPMISDGNMPMAEILDTFSQQALQWMKALETLLTASAEEDLSEIITSGRVVWG